MPVQTTCPACGAQISVNESGGQVTCPFCATQFEVDMNGVQPVFKVGDKPPEAAAQMEIIDPQVPLESSHPPTEPAAQPLIGEVVQPGSGGQAQVRFFGARWWVIVVAVMIIAFCLSCACMSVIILRIIHT